MQYLRTLDTLVSMLSRFNVNEPLTKYQLRYVKLHCVPSHVFVPSGECRSDERGVTSTRGPRHSLLDGILLPPT
jgi:hypothetical protein